jgi:hypothetical protein
MQSPPVSRHVRRFSCFRSYDGVGVQVMSIFGIGRDIFFRVSAVLAYTHWLQLIPILHRSPPRQRDTLVTASQRPT